MNKELLFIINELIKEYYTLVYVGITCNPYRLRKLYSTYSEILLELTQTSSTGEDIG